MVIFTSLMKRSIPVLQGEWCYIRKEVIGVVGTYFVFSVNISPPVEEDKCEIQTVTEESHMERGFSVL
jgi:hypothetical protein